jgi:hypothetical protein
VPLTAVDDPIVWANGKHFEQVMRTQGQLVLRGQRHDVDSFNIRDRSWGELRPEGHNPAPPYNWVHGVFDEIRTDEARRVRSRPLSGLSRGGTTARR